MWDSFRPASLPGGMPTVKDGCISPNPCLCSRQRKGEAGVFPLVRSFLGRHARQLQLTSRRELVMLGLVNVCMKPTEIVPSAFQPTLENSSSSWTGFGKGGSWQF